MGAGGICVANVLIDILVDGNMALNRTYGNIFDFQNREPEKLDSFKNYSGG